jgi:hypothetical protein
MFPLVSSCTWTQHVNLVCLYGPPGYKGAGQKSETSLPGQAPPPPCRRPSFATQFVALGSYSVRLCAEKKVLPPFCVRRVAACAAHAQRLWNALSPLVPPLSYAASIYLLVYEYNFMQQLYNFVDKPAVPVSLPPELTAPDGALRELPPNPTSHHLVAAIVCGGFQPHQTLH